MVIIACTLLIICSVLLRARAFAPDAAFHPNECISSPLLVFSCLTNMNSRSTSQASVSVTPTVVNLVEGGPSDTFTVSLVGAQPRSNVTVTVLINGSSVVASPSTFTLTPQAFDTPQDVTLTALNNFRADGPRTALVRLQLVSADTAFNGLVTPNVTTYVADDDVVSCCSRWWKPFCRELSRNPKLPGSILLSCAAHAVRVRMRPAGHARRLRVSPALCAKALTSTASCPLQASLVIRDSALVVTEGGASNTTTLVLTAQPVSLCLICACLPSACSHPSLLPPRVPRQQKDMASPLHPSNHALQLQASNVVVYLVNNNTAAATVSPTNITFTPNSWNVTQVVNISAVNNNLVDGTRAAQVTVTIASADAVWAALPQAAIALTVLDDDQVSGGDVIRRGHGKAGMGVPAKRHAGPTPVFPTATQTYANTGRHVSLAHAAEPHRGRR